MEIKAAVVFEQGGKFNLEQLTLDEPRADEVVVKIAGAGICHTDLGGRDGHLPNSQFPCVLGHEGAGVVEAVGVGVTKVKPGDHVVLSWGSCSGCPSCMSGKPAYCPDFFLYNFNGARVDGSPTMKKGDQLIHGSFFGQSSFADYALASVGNVVKVRNDIAPENLAPLGCGVLTGAGAVMNSLKPAVGSSIAVFGTGTVGMSAIMGAAVCGCTTIIAVDLNEQRLEKAKELGATHTVNAATDDPVLAVKEITGGGVQYSLECVGNPKVLRQAVDVLARLGVCGLLGVVPPGTEVALDMDLIMNGRMVRGIIEGDAVPDLFIPTLIDLHTQGRLPFDRLGKFYAMEDINQAVADMESGTVIKPILKP